MVLLRKCKVLYDVNCILVSIVNFIHLLFSMCWIGQELVLSATDLGYGLRAHNSESLVEVHSWFFNQFVWIPRRSIIVWFLSLLAKAGLNCTLTEYTEGQTFFLVVENGSPTPSRSRECCSSPLWAQGGRADTLACGGRGGIGDPILTKGQTL